MLNTLINFFEPYNVFLIIFVIVYGFAFGILNTFVRIKWLISGGGVYMQSWQGRLFDTIFYLCVVLVYFINWG